MGSDHCPVYAVLKEKVDIAGYEVYTRDIMSAGLFKDGVRQREWSAKDLLPMSAKLISEFDRRRSIRDMFAKKPSLPKAKSSMSTVQEEARDKTSLPQGGSGIFNEEATEALESKQPPGIAKSI